MQNNYHKPPRPPPLSVSQPSKPPPAQPQPQPRPQPQPQLQPQSQPQPQPKPKTHSNSNLDESPKSPLRSDSSHRSDEHELDFPKNGNALVVHEKYYSPLTSPAPVTPPKDAAVLDNFSSPPHHFVSVNVNHNRREEEQTQTGVVLGDAAGGGERKGRVGVGGERKGVGRGVRFPGVENIIGRKSKKEEVVEKVNLGVRVLEIVFCLISFSVMAADRTQGWSGDSFDRYKEYRFCLSVNVLGFLYSAFQAYDVVSHMVTGKHVISHHLRYQFDFVMDQIFAYLLISASSAAASRVDDWQANWGKDEFTEKASASISMAFLAFLGFAMSSLISGYNLCNRDLP